MTNAISGVVVALIGTWLIPDPSVAGPLLIGLGALSFVLVMVLFVAGVPDMAVMALIGGAALVMAGLHSQRKGV